MNKVNTHRVNYEWLGDIDKDKIHALEISVKTHDE